MPEVVLLTTTEVAARFRVDTSVVRRWVSSGKLTPTITTPGGHYRFSEDYIASFETTEQLVLPRSSKSSTQRTHASTKPFWRWRRD